MPTTSLPVIPAIPAASDAAWAALEQIIAGETRRGRHDRMLYATDASLYQVEPLGVVIPRHAQDVAAAVGWAAAQDVPLVPRGGGTSLAGQAVGRGLVIDCSRWMQQIVSLDVDARRATVQPGVVLDALNARAATAGLRFGPDVATSTHATLGGMIGNNSAGAHSVLYGRTVEHVRAMDVLLADGTALRLDEGGAERDRRVHEITRRVAAIVLDAADEIDRRFPRTRRRVDGYNLDLLLAQLRSSAPGTFDRVNLAHLLCGSEGTLALTLQADLNLVPDPPCRGLAVVSWPDVDAALRSVPALLKTGPAAIELIDDMVIALARGNALHAPAVDLLPTSGTGDPGAVLYVEYVADDAAALADSFDRLAAAAGNQPWVRLEEPAAMARAWSLRKAGEPLLGGMPGRRKPLTFIEDTAVDPARLASFVEAFRRMVASHGTRAAFYAHASVGCLHIRPLLDPGSPVDRDAMEAIARDATDLVIEYGGALSGEHGDGRVRSHLLERFYGRRICAAFAGIKDVFDPERRLNPGIIVDPLPMTAGLRAAPRGRVLPGVDTATYFKWTREHGFAEAVNTCNGAGICRRRSGGTMCPSYRATLDERHATRGRANALRLAITGQLGASDGPAWDDPETLRTLDLCLSCSACSSECPSNVDVTRLKAEYLGQRHRAKGRAPLGALLVAHARTLHQAGSALHPVSTRLLGVPMIRRAVQRAIGLDPRRSLPTVGPSLLRWKRRRASTAQADAPAVLLFPDCFCTYGEPAVGRAAVRLLERRGFRVIVPDGVGCCGRTAMSAGVLDVAVAQARAAVRQLAALQKQHGAESIVVCEPSCSSAIRSDWTDLRLGLDPALVAGVARSTFAIEAFVDEDAADHAGGGAMAGAASEPPSVCHDECTAGQAPGSATDLTGRAVLIHGHCHDKSTAGAAQRLLASAGAEVTTLDSGCCGMAGAWGMRRDHHELSLRIARQSLGAALAAQPDAIIAAAGTSCRHQVRDVFGRIAEHPVVLLDQAT